MTSPLLCCLDFSRRAVRLLRSAVVLWNWKSALLSVLIRSVALFCLVARQGHQAAVRAALLEAGYVALTAGFYAALQQGALRVRPRWAATLGIVAGVPVLAQTVDYLLQRAMGTPHMKTASMGMVLWGMVSASFHLHLMRHGAMLVGSESRSLGNDMKRMPRLVALFVAAPVLVVRRALDAQGSRHEANELTRAA